MVALVAIAAVACAPTASPSPAPSATGSPTPSSSSTATPTNAATSSGSPATPDLEGYVPVAMPESAVRTVELPATFGLHRIDSDGPLVVLDQRASSAARSVELFDLAKGTHRTLVAAPAGYQVWTPAISGTLVAWIDWHYEGDNDTGACDWEIEIQDVSGVAPARTLVRGVQQRAGAGFGASWPALDLDGDRVVYAIEDPAAAPDGWQIIVRTVAGDIEKTIHTRQPVYDLAASGGAIAWTEGRIDEALGYTTDAHLYVAQGTATTGTELATNAYEVALDGRRLAWTQDIPGGKGAAIGSRIWSADLATLTPQAVSPEPGGGTEQHQEWPATGDGIVTWGSERLSLADPSLNGDRLAAWSPALGHAIELLPSPGAILSGVGGGWIVWVNDHAEPQTLSGIPEQAISLP